MPCVEFKVNKSLVGKVIRIISKDYVKEHHYYKEKDSRAYFSRQSAQEGKSSLTKRVLGSDMRVLGIASNNGVLVSYNRTHKHSFYIKLEDWGIDYIYSVDIEPEFYI